MKVYNIKEEKIGSLKSELLNMGLIANIDGTLYYNNDYKLLYKINIIQSRLNNIKIRVL